MTVKQIQCLLAYLGYYTIAIDGISGNGTTKAIKEFQAAAGLQVDGICGDSTETALVDAVGHNQLFKEEKSDESTQSENFWDTVKYFKREEFKCQCGGKYCNGFPYEPSERLIRLADKVREELGVPMTVSSGLRCDKHNAEVGGVPTSYHRLGRAMDFAAKGKTASQILAIVKQHPEVHYTYAINSNYVHMDVAQ